VIKREQQCWNFHPESTGTATRATPTATRWWIPNKLALLTPGIDRKTGEYLDFGVPATVVANYLREQRIVPEKCDLNSILFLMTPAEDESKLNTLIAKLVKFKNLWDRDARSPRCCRRSSAAHSERYAGYTLRQVCNESAPLLIASGASRSCWPVLPRRLSFPDAPSMVARKRLREKKERKKKKK
jgi:arginine/lysine/ornithine decarboxylase